MDGIFEMGFTKPSKIQGLALPIAMQGRNIIGQARNGSGKTAAFALAMLANVETQKKSPQGLCVCPTRELTMQNHAVIQRLGKFTGLEFFLAVPQEQRAPRSVNAQVVVGTPGKLQDWLKKRIINPKDFRIFVVDEADQMIDEEQSMGGQVLDIRRMLSKDLQILFFSATWPDYVAKLAKSMVPNPNVIHVKKEDLTLTTITQTFMNVGTDDNKKYKLSELYSVMNVGQSIIFVNTRQTAWDLATFMKANGHTVSLITGTQKGQIEVAERDRVMEEFRTLVTRVLISTDVLSRGIDVPSVTVVVNYDLPNGTEKMETYLHRIGRTGRFGKKGLAVNLASDRDRHRIDEIKRFYNCDMAELSGDVEEVEAMLKPILG
ncbi:DBP5 [Symbiodinium natans]|uniref:RNA helicase n=1 Tax=Symbiodinium natans TaxID=878477 RepID=A0A812SDC8_9DINO|nr:DBP5 [Symbiodinium natans]